MECTGFPFYNFLNQSLWELAVLRKEEPETIV